MKIYSGFIYTGKGGLKGCYDTINAMRPHINQMIDDKYHRFLADHAAELIDEPFTGSSIKHKPGCSPFRLAAAEWRERRNNNADRIRDPSVDVDCKVSLFPVGSVILGIPWMDDSLMHEWFFEQNCISEYGYWNSTDRPSNITGAEWGLRKRRWKKAASGDTFRDTGIEMWLSRCLTPHYLMPDTLNKVMPFIASPEERAKIRAPVVAQVAKISEIIKADPGMSPLHAVGMANDWVQSEGQSVVDEHIERLSKLLPVITPALLNAPM